MEAWQSHVLGDYLVQSEWMAMSKSKHSGPALAHAASYTACFLPITRNWKALAVIGGTHYVIDRYRLVQYPMWASNQVAPREYRYPFSASFKSTGANYHTPVWLATSLMVIVDNALHHSINKWALRRWH